MSIDTIGPISAIASMVYCAAHIAGMIREWRVNNKAVEAAKREQRDYMAAQYQQALEQLEAAKRLGSC